MAQVLAAPQQNTTNTCRGQQLYSSLLAAAPVRAAAAAKSAPPVSMLVSTAQQLTEFSAWQLSRNASVAATRSVPADAASQLQIRLHFAKLGLTDPLTFS